MLEYRKGKLKGYEKVTAKNGNQYNRVIYEGRGYYFKGEFLDSSKYRAIDKLRERFKGDFSDENKQRLKDEWAVISKGYKESRERTLKGQKKLEIKRNAKAILKLRVKNRFYKKIEKYIDELRLYDIKIDFKINELSKEYVDEFNQIIEEISGEAK